jgi:hypothetical protein
MDEIVRKIAALGLPGVILAITMIATGGMGSVGLVSAITVLGGPLELAGGLAILSLMTGLGNVICGYGLDVLLTSVDEERKKTESLPALRQEVRELLISDHLKVKLNLIL